MHPPHRAELLARLADDALVLDVGGWASPLSRADWVIDLMPHATRGLYRPDPEPERFTAATWVQRDICAREPWPFPDDRFDFVVCSQTLEDIRDPVWVCEEIARVGRAGYVEVPSRLEEQAWGVEGPWTGRSHHRWLCEIDRDRADIRFTFKFHVVHAEPWFFPEGFAARLGDEQRIDWLWWDGGFTARERVHMDPAELAAELEGFVREHRGDVPPAPGRLRRAARAVRRAAR